MPSPPLPNEILFQILHEAIILRSRDERKTAADYWIRLGRCLRLRLISKSFAKLIPDIIFASGLLELGKLPGRYGPRAGPHPPGYMKFASDYILYKVRTADHRSRGWIWQLRQIAEAIVRHDNSNAAFDFEQHFDIVYSIAQLSVRGDHFNTWQSMHADELNEWWPCGRVDEGTEEFRRMLLSTAAYLNKRDLVINLLAQTFHVPIGAHLNMFESPITCACLAGNFDLMYLIASDLTSKGLYTGFRRSVALAAVETRQESLLDTVLHGRPIDLDKYTERPRRPETSGLDDDDLRELFQAALTRMTTMRSFGHLYSIWNNEIVSRPNMEPVIFSKWFRDPLPGDNIQDMLAAVNCMGTGADQVLFQDDDWPCRPDCLINARMCRHAVARAALHGRYGVVKHLLETGIEQSHALSAACQAGQYHVAELLLGAMTDTVDEDEIQAAFIGATNAENEALVRVLVEKLQPCNAVLDVAVDHAELRGLDSMATLLRSLQSP